MVSKNLIFSSLLFLFSLNSCDCIRFVEGVVLDFDTKLPQEGVQIVNSLDFDRGITTYLVTTDEQGNFSYSDISGGLFGCPKLVLVFSKEGYLNQRLSFEQSSSRMDTIYLKR